MKLITVSGPPSSGKTSVIVHIAKALRSKDETVGVVKLDCLSTTDNEIYNKNDIPNIVGLSGGLCPDHFFGSNLHECIDWALERELDSIFVESAGSCNRCSPHLKGCYAICVIDNLMGANAPKKIGPMLKMADTVVLTKGDVVSQAEREVFDFHVRQANARGLVFPVSGVTGQGCAELADIVRISAASLPKELQLRFPMPAAMCAYCLGETDLKPQLQFGNKRKMVVK